MSIPCISNFKPSMASEYQTYLASARRDPESISKLQVFTTAILDAWSFLYPATSIFSECCGCGKISLYRLSPVYSRVWDTKRVEEFGAFEEVEKLENASRHMSSRPWDDCDRCGPEVCNLVYGTTSLSMDTFREHLYLLRCCWCWRFGSCGSRRDRSCGHTFCCHCDMPHGTMNEGLSHGDTLQAFQEAVKVWESDSTDPSFDIHRITSTVKTTLAKIQNPLVYLVPPATIGNTIGIPNPLNMSTQPGGIFPSDQESDSCGVSQATAPPGFQPRMSENDALRRECANLIHRDGLQDLIMGDKNNRLIVLETLELKQREQTNQSEKGKELETDIDTRFHEASILCNDLGCPCQLYRVAPPRLPYAIMDKEMTERLCHLAEGAVRDLKTDSQTWLGALETLTRLKTRLSGTFADEPPADEPPAKLTTPEEEEKRLAVLDKFKIPYVGLVSLPEEADFDWDSVLDSYPSEEDFDWGSVLETYYDQKFGGP